MFARPSFCKVGQQGSNTETLRFIAVFALISYHTIGVTPEDALRIDYPHPLRFFADGLLDIRMPLFAYISGWVYAQRPVGANGFGRFITGKIRRLYVPGVAAALTFWALATFVVPNSVGQAAPIWRILTLSYVHYWFLPAILLILVGAALVEKCLRGPLPPAQLIGAALLFLSLPVLHVPGLPLGGAHYLAPFFIMGVLFARQAHWINRHRVAIAVVAFVATGSGIALNLDVLRWTGQLSLNQRDLQSALVSTGSVTLLALFLPRIAAFSAFGPLAFTIYLYHVFGTSGMRRAADFIGVEATWLVFSLCVAAGFGVPFVFRLIVSKTKATRTIFLGLRPAGTAPAS